MTERVERRTRQPAQLPDSLSAFKERNLKAAERVARASVSANELIKSTNDDLARTRTEMFLFIGALAFVAVTTFSITDRALLVGSRAKLPLLDVMVGFDEFMIGAPFILLGAHFALLLKFNALRLKCYEISRQLNELARSNGEVARNLSMLVGTNFLAQWLAGIETDRFYRSLNWTIYAIALVIAPILVLMLVTVRTLPLHRDAITFTQLVILTFDIWLLAYFHLSRSRRVLGASILCLPAWVLATLFFSIPDSFPDRIGRSIWPASAPFSGQEAGSRRIAFGPTAFFLESEISPATRRPIFWFSRNLVVPDDPTLSEPTILLTSGPSATTSTARPDGRVTTTISLRGRDLRYAILSRSNLRGADLTSANLSGADLEGADLRGATFGCVGDPDQPITTLWLRMLYADRKGRWEPTTSICTTLSDAKLEKVDFRNARFTGFNFSKPSLQSLNLRNAILDGVDLRVCPERSYGIA